MSPERGTVQDQFPPTAANIDHFLVIVGIQKVETLFQPVGQPATVARRKTFVPLAVFEVIGLVVQSLQSPKREAR